MSCVPILWKVDEEFGEDAVNSVDFGPKCTVRIAPFADGRQIAL